LAEALARQKWPMALRPHVTVGLRLSGISGYTDSADTIGHAEEASKSDGSDIA
jgi:hypothetical protein